MHIASLSRTFRRGEHPSFPQSAVGGRKAVLKLNENICEQIERAAQLLRDAAARSAGSKRASGDAASKRPARQEFVDTAASLEAMVKRSRRK